MGLAMVYVCVARVRRFGQSDGKKILKGIDFTRMTRVASLTVAMERNYLARGKSESEAVSDPERTRHDVLPRLSPMYS